MLYCILIGMLSFKQKIETLSKKPGVYLFKNVQGEILYVGKAKNLRARVRSYFQKGHTREERLRIMISEIADLDYTIVSTETESLILENNFIKQYRPRFNVRLRDDKNYQFIKIDYESEIPRIYAVRKTDGKPRGKNKYFGPYTSGLVVKATLKLIRRVFNLCGNKKVSAYSCFYFQIGRCPGVCVGKVSVGDYKKTLRQVEDFLHNRQPAVLRGLTAEMRLAARAKQFEKAAGLRDSIRSLARIWERQKVVFVKPVSEDYLSLHRANSAAFINLFMVRTGKIIHQEVFELAIPEGSSDDQILESFVKQYYFEASDVPKSILLPVSLVATVALQQWLGAKIVRPRRGRRYQLLKLGTENAQNYSQKIETSFEEALKELQAALRLPEKPARIETYDISNIQGFLPVGSMVVFTNGQSDKSQYRKFKINLKQTPDDVAMMREMLTRRFARPLIRPSATLFRTGRGAGGGEDWPLPNLIVIDGGRGQLNAALEILTTYNLQLPIIGFAKRFEEIFIPGKKKPLRLPDDSPALHLLQRMRDEAHRFAITFYRSRHRQEMTHTRLLEIPGIGPATRRKLLARFGSLSGIRSVSFEALAAEIGSDKAKKILEQL